LRMLVRTKENNPVSIYDKTLEGDGTDIAVILCSDKHNTDAY